MEISDNNKPDFMETVLFHSTTDMLKSNYLDLVKMLKETFPSLPKQVVALLEKQTCHHRAMQMMMVFVLAMDEDNGFTRYAYNNARSPPHLMFFRQMMGIMLRNFLRPQQAGDPRVPDPKGLMAIVYNEYTAYRDDCGRFAEHYKQEQQQQQQMKQKPNSCLPRDGSLLRGK